MAGNSESGKSKVIELSAKQILDGYREYTAKCFDEERGQTPWDFFTFLNLKHGSALLTADIVEFRKRFRKGEYGAYKEHSKALDIVFEAMRGEWGSSPLWRNQNANKAVVLMSQDWGDGDRVYRQAAESASGASSGIKIAFGGNDARDVASGD